MEKSKLYKYTCYQCLKQCTQIIRDTPNEVEVTLSGYDDLRDCEYYYELEGEYKEEK